jgi:hypothetical protein
MKPMRISNTMKEHLLECKRYTDLGIPCTMGDFQKTLPALLKRSLVEMKKNDRCYTINITPLGLKCLSLLDEVEPHSGWYTLPEKVF